MLCADDTQFYISTLGQPNDVVEAPSQCLDAVGKMGKNRLQVSPNKTD